MEQILENRTKKKPINKNRMAFIIGGITLPIIAFLVFYLYVNFSSFVLAFQDNRTGAFTLDNFRGVIESMKDPKGTLSIALKNTLKYFITNIGLMFAIEYVKRLKQVDVNCELHIFPKGEHGCGLYYENDSIACHNREWSTLLLRWLQFIGFMRNGDEE